MTDRYYASASITLSPGIRFPYWGERPRRKALTLQTVSVGTGLRSGRTITDDRDAFHSPGFREVVGRRIVLC